jgi:malonyl-CoA O-methyltransferase
VTTTAGSATSALRNAAAAQQPGDQPALVSVSEGYDRWASTYDSTSNPLLALEQRCVPPLLPPLENKWVLDLACGTGRWFDSLAIRGAARVLGVDSSAAMLSVAATKKYCSGSLVRGDACRLPFPQSHFDFAICSFAVGHIPALNLFGAECRRVLKPAAELFVTDMHPEAYNFGWRTGFRDKSGPVEIATVIRRSHELIAVFCSAGFKCARLDQFAFGLSETSIFSRSGRIEEFQHACRLPAILLCRFH